MLAQLWEWAVLRDERNRPVGLCGTKHAAMAALAKALIAAGRPGQGHIAQATLVRPVLQESQYIRDKPEQTATYDGTVITWT
jgi:hypothetical protein